MRKWPARTANGTTPVPSELLFVTNKLLLRKNEPKVDPKTCTTPSYLLPLPSFHDVGPAYYRARHGRDGSHKKGSKSKAANEEASAPKTADGFHTHTNA
jgi:hypothetical protein